MSVLESRLAEQKTAELYRQRKVLTGPSALYMHDDQHSSMLSFCSNDYLSLANDARVVATFRQAAVDYGVGSGAAQLICGHRRAHQELELAFAEFTGFPRALLFSNGYMANLGVLTALTTLQDHIFQDRYNHASLLDAGRMARAKSRRYLHGDVASLVKYLCRVDNGRSMIVTDGVFSMSGTIAPLLELVQLAKRYDATLVIDDAHGVGVLGNNGRGSLEHLGIEPSAEMVMIYPLGKAFGGYGAIVAGSEVVIESLIQFARSYIYTTALPPALASAALTSLQIIRQETWRREKLLSLIDYFRDAAIDRQLPVGNSFTPIQTLSIGNNQWALQVAAKLQQAGFLVYALRPPTVPKALLRITLRVDHTVQQIAQLLDCLLRVMNEL